MVDGHKIKRRIEIKEYLNQLEHYDASKINITEHAYFRLSENERKIFKDEVIKKYIISQTPKLVGIQGNGNYAVFLEYTKKETLRIILDIQLEKINVVTFYIIDNTEIPQI